MASKLVCCGLFSAAVSAIRSQVGGWADNTSTSIQIASAAARAVDFLHDGLSISMTEDEVADAFRADPELYDSFDEHASSLSIKEQSDVSFSLLERAAVAVNSTGHKQALEDALKRKDSTACVCMLRAKRVKEGGFFSKFELDLMVPLIDFDDEDVDNCDDCFGMCKDKDKYELAKDAMEELGFDNLDKYPDGPYVAAQCESEHCNCLDAEQTVKQLKRYKSGVDHGKVDVTFFKKNYGGHNHEDQCLKSCKKECDKEDSKGLDVEGLCVDEKHSED